jgi:hypothetical protein
VLHRFHLNNLWVRRTFLRRIAFWFSYFRLKTLDFELAFHPVHCSIHESNNGASKNSILGCVALLRRNCELPFLLNRRDMITAGCLDHRAGTGTWRWRDRLRAKRASHIDPPKSPGATMRRGKGVYGEPDIRPGIPSQAPPGIFYPLRFSCCGGRKQSLTYRSACDAVGLSEVIAAALWQIGHMGHLTLRERSGRPFPRRRGAQRTFSRPWPQPRPEASVVRTNNTEANAAFHGKQRQWRPHCWRHWALVLWRLGPAPSLRQQAAL